MALTVQIQKRYGSFLLDVDFTVENRQVLALLGASGCGKSATLKCVAGTEKPDRGRITLDRRVLFDSASRINLPPQNRRMGFLFQNYALFPHMTVEGNVAVCLKRMETSRRRARVRKLLSLLRLEGLESLYPRQLSGGQQQRVALARILATDPQVLLLDEPFSALDGFLKWRLEQELREILDRFSGPVIWVSHDRGEVYRNCRRVCLLEGGKSAPVADMAELMENPGSVSAARLSGCENYASVCFSQGLLKVPEWGVTLRAAAPWRPGHTVLGLRAASLHPAKPEECNAFSCRVIRVVEDVVSIFAALYPDGGDSQAPPLWMELPKSVWAALPDRTRLLVAVRPEDLMLLKQEEIPCTKPQF